MRMLSAVMYGISATQVPWLLAPGAGIGRVPGLARATPPMRQYVGRVSGHRQMRRSVKAEAAAQGAAVVTDGVDKAVSVKASVTVQLSAGGLLTNIRLSRGLDDISDLLGKTFLLELLSSDLNPRSGTEKEAVKGYAHKTCRDGNKVSYEAEFVVPTGFGEVGAVLVENEHHKEMHLTSIHLAGLPFGDLHITCNSWVHSKFDNPNKRIFFTNKSYLPSETPSGIKRLRARELEILRGDGCGERKSFDRVYDYDT